MKNNNEKDSINELVLSVCNYSLGIVTGGILNLEPILKTHNYYVALKDKLFTEKIIKFVEELNSLNEKEKIELANFKIKLESDKEFQEKVSFALISYTDKSDRLEKSILLAKVFKAYLSEKLDLEIMFRLQKSIVDCPLEALNKIENVYSSEVSRDDNNNYIYQDLYLAGLLRAGVLDFSSNGENYLNNELGRKYYEVIYL